MLLKTSFPGSQLLTTVSDRYTHAQLPWLGITAECYVTVVNTPSDFWIQIKSEHLNDLHTISQDIQIACEVRNDVTYCTRTVCPCDRQIVRYDVRVTVDVRIQVLPGVPYRL